MKRLINYIKNLFGADERLRKWCLTQSNDRLPYYMVVKHADDMYNWIKRGKTPL